MKIHAYIQSKSGDFNYEKVVEQGSNKLLGEFRDFDMVVKHIQSRGGYYMAGNYGGRLRFIPFHEIEYIEDRTPECTG